MISTYCTLPRALSEVQRLHNRGSFWSPTIGVVSQNRGNTYLVTIFYVREFEALIGVGLQYHQRIHQKFMSK